MEFKRVKFIQKEKSDFFKVLRSRVDSHFKENNITKFGNTKMVIKTITLLCVYFTPLVFLFTYEFPNFWSYMIPWFIMGVGMAGCGLSIMHDAAHGAYSQNKNVNTFLAHILNVLGGNSMNWKLQHNVLHHSYTNIDGFDEDLNPGAVMRFSPNRKYRKAFKFQHIYAWFLYSLMTVMWITVKDFRQLIRFRSYGLLKGTRVSFKREMTKILITKVLYFTYILVLPIVLTPAPWWWVVIGLTLLHLTAGFILSCVFQPAHIVESSDFPMPDTKGVVEDEWAIHQLKTTANFAQNSTFFSWFVGGLNYQVEHHLFPNICHVHYRDLSKIVKKTAEEYGLPYHQNGSFIATLIQHGKMLKKLGIEKYDWSTHVHPSATSTAERKLSA